MTIHIMLDKLVVVLQNKPLQLQTEVENTGKWKAYSIDLSKYFKADPGAIYSVEVKF